MIRRMKPKRIMDDHELFATAVPKAIPNSVPTKVIPKVVPKTVPKAVPKAIPKAVPTKAKRTRVMDDHELFSTDAKVPASVVVVVVPKVVTRPDLYTQVRGQVGVLSRLSEWWQQRVAHKEQVPPIALLTGRSGVGKSLAAQALCAHFGFEAHSADASTLAAAHDLISGVLNPLLAQNEQRIAVILEQVDDDQALACQQLVHWLEKLTPGELHHMKPLLLPLDEVCWKTRKALARWTCEFKFVPVVPKVLKELWQIHCTCSTRPKCQWSSDFFVANCQGDVRQLLNQECWLHLHTSPLTNSKVPEAPAQPYDLVKSVLNRVTDLPLATLELWLQRVGVQFIQPWFHFNTYGALVTPSQLDETAWSYWTFEIMSVGDVWRQALWQDEKEDATECAGMDLWTWYAQGMMVAWPTLHPPQTVSERIRYVKYATQLTTKKPPVISYRQSYGYSSTQLGL